MNKLHLMGTVYAFVLTFVTTASHAAFIGRLPAPPSSGIDFLAYYDDQLDITWTAVANINGLATWDNQVAWAAGLGIAGASGWRLPSMDVNGDGTIVNCLSSTQAACKDNEYNHLFSYGAGTTLGSGVTVAAPGPFSNVQFAYWSGTEFATDLSKAWSFSFDIGGRATTSKGASFNAWAVQAGDVSASLVPIPGAVWLFGSGLLGLIGIAIKKVS